ncbi:MULTISPECIES: REP-associated tyrosine transposase [Pseudomonas syringae group]|uniref:Transposase n=1 Tax=Pseudomonas lijiangensis TaxID=2995658 RepID=A0ABX8HPM0_9PSED|nr:MULTISPECIES: transposase [Pseudomonas syringae group]MBX8500308.1 transposase [Pseudomonas lijiangensis]MBX8505560.1 transposase [Pseudomonas lijiangensis]MBX8556035.1 transposase [Pseudomonas cichorii]MBX8558203.1 transposase [Pseudomonas cichorii]QWU82364.1 transposase [Pseudomonas lijiangensis]
MPEKSHSRNLRKGRFSGRGQLYLVTATTLGREPVFTDWLLGRLLVNELRHAHEMELVNSLAWVVMPDHLHWLFELRTDSLPRVMQRVKSRSTITLNKASKRIGRLWQDGYHDRAIRREQDILAVARYIVANPERAGLVNNIREYSLWDAAWI